jgi:hypothetical protein
MPVTVMATLIGDRHTRREPEKLIEPETSGNGPKLTRRPLDARGEAKALTRSYVPDSLRLEEEAAQRGRPSSSRTGKTEIARRHAGRASLHREQKSVMQARVATLETKQFQGFSLSDCI